MKLEPMAALNAIGQALFDKKGMNILALDVRKISNLTDYVIIAEGTVDRHVIALAQTVIGSLKKLGEIPLYTEGLPNGDWVVLDYGEVMVHLFMPGLRDKYHLEELWREGEIVELAINTSTYKSGT